MVKSLRKPWKSHFLCTDIFIWSHGFRWFVIQTTCNVNIIREEFRVKGSITSIRSESPHGGLSLNFSWTRFFSHPRMLYSAEANVNLAFFHLSWSVGFILLLNLCLKFVELVTDPWIHLISQCKSFTITRESRELAAVLICQYAGV